MTTTNIKVTLSTNSLARDTDAVADLLGVSGRNVRHNGGKVVIVTCEVDEVAAVSERMDGAYQVSSYEVRQS